MTVQRMSKEAEARILSALDKVGVMTEGGKDPNESIAKCAADAGVPAGHINVMVNAFNTGRTLSQRTQHTEHTEKAAKFTLADKEVVLELLYPSQQKQASVSADYEAGPDFLMRRDLAVKRSQLEQEMAEKQAAAGPAVEEAAPPVSVDGLLNQHKYDQRRMKAARAEISQAGDDLQKKAASLSVHFRSPGVCSIADARRTCEMAAGEKAAAVFNYVEGLHGSFSKQAATGRVLSAAEAMLPQVQEIIKLSTDLSAARKAYARLNDDLVRSYREKVAASAAPGSTSQSCLRTPDDLGPADFAEDGFMKMAGNMLAIPPTMAILRKGLSGIGSSTSPKPTSAAVQRALLEIDKPRYNRELRGVEAQIMLSGLMADDPELSQHDPQAIATAFSEISKAAPNAAQQPLLMKGLLRRHLEQGHLDPFDVGESVLKSEKSITDAKGDKANLDGSNYPDAKPGPEDNTSAADGFNPATYEDKPKSKPPESKPKSGKGDGRAGRDGDGDGEKDE